MEVKEKNGVYYRVISSYNCACIVCTFCVNYLLARTVNVRVVYHYVGTVLERPVMKPLVVS